MLYNVEVNQVKLMVQIEQVLLSPLKYVRI